MTRSSPIIPRVFYNHWAFVAIFVCQNGENWRVMAPLQRTYDRDHLDEIVVDDRDGFFFQLVFMWLWLTQNVYIVFRHTLSLRVAEERIFSRFVNFFSHTCTYFPMPNKRCSWSRRVRINYTEDTVCVCLARCVMIVPKNFSSFYVRRLRTGERLKYKRNPFNWYDREERWCRREGEWKSETDLSSWSSIFVTKFIICLSEIYVIFYFKFLASDFHTNTLLLLLRYSRFACT